MLRQGVPDADPSVKPVWELPAKLLLGGSGSSGNLKIAAIKLCSMVGSTRNRELGNSPM